MELISILRKLCEMKKAQLLGGAVCIDHDHMYIASPPKKLSVSEVVAYLKGKSVLWHSIPTLSSAQDVEKASLGKGILCVHSRECE